MIITSTECFDLPILSFNWRAKNHNKVICGLLTMGCCTTWISRTIVGLVIRIILLTEVFFWFSSYELKPHKLLFLGCCTAIHVALLRHLHTFYAKKESLYNIYWLKTWCHPWNTKKNLMSLFWIYQNSHTSQIKR